MYKKRVKFSSLELIKLAADTAINKEEPGFWNKEITDGELILLADGDAAHVDDIMAFAKSKSKCYALAGHVTCTNNVCRLTTHVRSGSAYYVGAGIVSRFTMPSNKFNTLVLGIQEKAPATAKDMCSPSSNSSRISICESCGIYTDKLSHAIGNIFTGEKRCLRCVVSLYAICAGCNKVQLKNTMVYVAVSGGEYLECEKCRLNNKNCPKCKRTVFHDDFDTNEEVCVRCVGMVLNEYTYKPVAEFKLLDGEKENVFLGIEIEVEMKQPYEDLMLPIATRFHKDVKSFAYLKKDFSLSAKDGDPSQLTGFEIVTHPGTLGWWQSKTNPLFTPLTKLAYTCESWPSENCGIHVHISRSAFQSNEALARFLYFVGHNPRFMTFIGERFSKYQASNFDVFESLPVGIASGKQPVDRHAAVNLGNNSTIEVRIFRGNMRQSRILKNIEFVKALSKYCNTVKDTVADAGISFSAPSLTAQAFKTYVIQNKETYPNLYSFISKYAKET